MHKLNNRFYKQLRTALLGVGDDDHILSGGGSTIFNKRYESFKEPSFKSEPFQDYSGEITNAYTE